MTTNAEAPATLREALASALRARALEAEQTACDDECDPVDCPSCGQPIQAFSFIDGRPDTVFGEPEAIADALLAGPLAGLIAERDQAVAQVAAVRALTDEIELNWAMEISDREVVDALRRALGDD